MSIRKLPIVQPPIVGFHFHAFPLSIIFSSEKLHAWFFSHYIQTYCFQQPDGNPYYDFVSYNIWDRIPCLSDIHLLDRHTIVSCNIDIIELFKSYIDRGWYVFSGVDDFFIPFRASYQKTRQPHDIFLYGYNSENSCFYAAGFNAEEVFSFDQLHFEDLKKAFFYDRTATDKALSQIFDFCRFFTIREEFICEFDMKLVLALLHDYIHSIDTSENFRMHFTPPENHTYGLNTYKKLKECYRSMLNTDTEPDIRPAHIFWEHKNCMLLRIKYMCENGFLDRKTPLYEEYMVIEEKALNIRNLLLKYEITKDSKCILRIINTLTELEEREFSVLSRLFNTLDS